MGSSKETLSMQPINKLQVLCKGSKIKREFTVNVLLLQSVTIIIQTGRVEQELTRESRLSLVLLLWGM